MANFTITSLDTTAEVLNDAEVGYVAEGAELVVNGSDAIGGTGHNRLVVLGNVTTVSFSRTEAYDFNGEATNIFVGQAGSLISVSGVALKLFSNTLSQVVNNGTIMGDIAAMDIRGSGGGSQISITNNGFISGNDGLLLNAGIFATYISNSGVISAIGDAIKSDAIALVELVNSGTIMSTTSDAIYLGRGDDTVTNTGTIIGAIYLGSGDDLFDGRNGVQSVIDMAQGNDTVFGGSGAELIVGGQDEDEVHAGGGNDTISVFVDTADDVYDGGDGSDLVSYRFATLGMDVNLTHGVAQAGSVGIDNLFSIENVITGTGDDTVTGNADNNLIRTGAGADLVFGKGGLDRLRGGLGNDTLVGGDGNDRLFGEEDDDRLNGDDGDDLLVGGSGRDVQSGGAGADRFAFYDLADSGTVGGTIDRIADFEQGKDKIDISQIDAIPLTGADDAFAFIGTAAFSGTAGEVRFRQGATLTLVDVDQDGDGVADMSVRLDGVINLVAGDFIL